MEIRHKTVILSADDARKYLGYNYAHNRPIAQNHVEYLANEMRAGRFLQTAQVHLMHVNGQPVLINGQHTLSAVLKSGRNVMVDLVESFTDNPGDLAMYYSFGHDTGKGRTAYDALAAYNLAEELNLRRHHTNQLFAAVKYMAVEFDRRYGKERSGYPGTGQPATSGKRRQGVAQSVKIPSVELMPAMRRFAEPMRIYYRITRPTASDYLNNGMYKAPVLSVALVTLKYQQDIAVDFWRRVSQMAYHNSDGKWRDSAFKVVDIIERSYRAELPNKHPATLSRMVAYCWGRNLAGDLMQMARYGSIYDPIEIAGTPFDGTQDDYDMIMNNYD